MTDCGGWMAALRRRGTSGRETIVEVLTQGAMDESTREARFP